MTATCRQAAASRSPASFPTARRDIATLMAHETTSLSLLGRAKAKDNDAWEQLVHLYGPLVEKWCRKYGLQDDDVADVFQETFRTVSKHIESFVPGRSVASFRSWLKTIVRTRTMDHFRRTKRQVPGAGGTDAMGRIASVADPISDEDEEASENAIVVQRAMEMIRPEFAPRNWEAFKEVALKGASAVEVAKRLGVEPQTIRQANYRIRRRLKLILEDLVQGEDDAPTE